MDKRLKIGLQILAVGITATIGVVIFKRWRAKKMAEQDLISFSPNITNENEKKERIQEINTTSNPPTPLEINSSPIPFTSKEEGNAFRVWVNDNYPTYAKQIDLDRSGSYNNTFITKAWNQYGAEYTGSATGKSNQTLTKVVNKIKTIGVPIAKNVLTEVRSTIFGDPNKITTAPNVSQGFDKKLVAKALYDSMRGGGTNEKLFFDTMKQLDNNQKKLVKPYFNSKYGKGGLDKWVQDDFCSWIETRTAKGKKMCADAKTIITIT